MANTTTQLNRFNAATTLQNITMSNQTLLPQPIPILPPPPSVPRITNTLFPVKPTITTLPPTFSNQTYTGSTTTLASPTATISTSGVTYLVHPAAPKQFY